jgi:tRNA nucleotidyltransferase/poly(A) polymerase
MQWREELTRRFPALIKVSDDCYVVGGAIRDLLLGREPLDADLACIDPLQSARTIRDKVIRLGDAEELSAYRIVHRDRVYDFAAITGGTIEADLARRDFTINAMAVHLGRNELLDPHGGARDIEARLVRMVRAANFDDDPLRLLKAVRMAVTNGFAIEAETLEAIRARASRILDVAAERVTYELSIIFGAGKAREALALLQRTGLAEALGLRDVSVVDDVSLASAYALLVDDPRAHGERWRWSADLLRDVLTLQRLIDAHDRIALYDAGEAIAMQLLPLLRALGRDDRLDLPDFSLRALLTGDEIAQLTGIAPGQELGRIKRALLEAQIRDEVKTRDEAVKLMERRRPAGWPGGVPPPLP